MVRRWCSGDLERTVKTTMTRTQDRNWQSRKQIHELLKSLHQLLWRARQNLRSSKTIRSKIPDTSHVAHHRLYCILSVRHAHAQAEARDIQIFVHIAIGLYKQALSTGGYIPFVTLSSSPSDHVRQGSTRLQMKWYPPRNSIPSPPLRA